MTRENRKGSLAIRHKWLNINMPAEPSKDFIRKFTEISGFGGGIGVVPIRRGDEGDASAHCRKIVAKRTVARKGKVDK